MQEGAGCCVPCVTALFSLLWDAGGGSGPIIGLPVSPCLLANANLPPPSGAFGDSAEGGALTNPLSGTGFNHRNAARFRENAKINPGAEHEVPATPSLGKSYPGQRKGGHMRKTGLTLAAVAALATAAAVVTAPAEARGGRNAAIGFGVAAGVLGAAAAANAYNNGYYDGPRYGYYGGGPYAYYDDGPRYYRRGYYRHYDYW